MYRSISCSTTSDNIKDKKVVSTQWDEPNTSVSTIITISIYV